MRSHIAGLVFRCACSVAFGAFAFSLCRGHLNFGIIVFLVFVCVVVARGIYGSVQEIRTCLRGRKLASADDTFPFPGSFTASLVLAQPVSAMRVQVCLKFPRDYFHGTITLLGDGERALATIEIPENSPPRWPIPDRVLAKLKYIGFTAAEPGRSTRMDSRPPFVMDVDDAGLAVPSVKVRATLAFNKGYDYIRIPEEIAYHIVVRSRDPATDPGRPVTS